MFVWLFVPLTVLIWYTSSAEAGFCTESYKCTNRCSKQEKYYQKCGVFGWKRCARYRTTYHTCDNTCTRQVCCKGYTGADCSSPLCYGKTSCENNNKCVAPNQCQCKTGYALPRCTDINECASKKGGCQHDCTNTVGSFKCSCVPGYTLATDLKSCEDDNECARNNGGCSHLCNNIPGSYKCSCRAGYKLEPNGKSCVDLNECTAGTSGCTQGCANSVGSYTCTCSAGYTLAPDRKTCHDVDECSQTPFPCDQQCTNVPGSFRCGCDPGYLIVSGTNKCTDIDECSTKNGGCEQICNNTQGSFLCSCQPGYSLHADGFKCQDTDECKEGTARCSQKCINTPGGYECGCDPGYKLVSNGVCIDIDDCQGVTCHNGGECTDHVGSYTCSCSKGYTEKHCEQDINECAGFLNGGCEDQCINTDGAFYCQCTGNKTLNADGLSCTGSDGPSVFLKYGIVRRFLPRGCSTILLTKCDEGKDIHIFLSSTAKWYQLRSDPNRIYTYGIVFVEVNSVALPVSISGMEVIKSPTSFNLITGSLSLDVADGDVYGEERAINCWSFDITPRDIRDFLVSNSFLGSFFDELEDSLPDWIQFTPDGSEILGLNDLNSELMTGSEIQQIECQGAPLFADRMYTLLKFGNGFGLSLYGQDIKLPAPARNKKFCIIVDFCHDVGGSVFLMLPPDSRDILDKFDMFKKMIDERGLYVRPLGIGISVTKRINVHAKTTHMQQWNGDEFIQYPVLQKANLWIGGQAKMTTDLFKVTASTDAFLSIPSPVNILKSLFLEEWGFVIRMRAIGVLEFMFDTPFGKQTLRGFGDGEINALASLGGNHPRTFCGRNANPAGAFFSLIFDANAFVDAPILKYITISTDVKAYAFLASDPKTTQHNQTLIDVAKEVLDLNQMLVRFVNLMEDALKSYENLLSNHSAILLETVITTGKQMLTIVEEVVQDIGNFSFQNLQQDLQKIEEIWKFGWKQLQTDTNNFIDSIKENTRLLEYNVTEMVKNETASVKKRVHTLINGVSSQASLVFKDMNGAGFRFKAGINFIGLKILGLEIELVYSIDSLGQCGRFAKAYSVLKDEKALRAIAIFSTGIARFNAFLRMENGFGIGMAFSLQSASKFAAVIHVEARLLGVRAQTDLFITNKGIHFYLEGNIWNTFKAQLRVSAEVGKAWHDLSLTVRGNFVADANGDGKFDDSYLAALRNFTKTIAEKADKRISQLQDEITKYQKGLTSAQNWLEDKKQIFRDANSKFDDAVHALDKAKAKLEAAKKPFRDAQNELNEAQSKVDRLCKIKDCKKICVPGVKCKLCHKKVWKVKIPYPCCRFTKCMISFPDPICVGLNLLCKAARAVAYAALEAAKILVRIPMLALDGAKLLVSGAQFLVDKSRVVLDIAIAGLDLAKAGLEAAKGLLQGAKLALEAVKQVVKLGFAALNFIIKYGLENIIDVRNCGFEVVLSTHDLAVFDVHCEVNAFKTGFRKIEIRINFKDIFQSIWYAAKATITSILKSLGNIVGRKRREIEHQTLQLVYKHYRETRDTHMDTNASFQNLTIDTFAHILDSMTQTSVPNGSVVSDYQVRKGIFAQKCSEFKTIHMFLTEAITTLFEMTNETATTVLNLSFLQDEISPIKKSADMFNASLMDMGIDPSVAETEFNISADELMIIINEARENATSDIFLRGVEDMSRDPTQVLMNQSLEANAIGVMKYWLAAMDNVTQHYFNSSVCVSFLDCSHYAVATLYEMISPAGKFPNKRLSLTSISTFEDIFLHMTGNVDNFTVTEIHEMSLGLTHHLEAIKRTNVFCSEPPTRRSPPQNITIGLGQDLTLLCDATGNPAPIYTWYKEGDVFTKATRSMTYTISNVTKADEGMYNCVASNLVTDLTLPEFYVTVSDVCYSPTVKRRCKYSGMFHLRLFRDL